MNSNSPPASVFATPYVKDIIPSETGSTVKVRIWQTVQTTYPPGSREQFALQDALAPGEDKVVVSTRKITQRLSPAEAEKLTVGQPIEGHIARVLRSQPRYPSQKPAYEGGYASASWHSTYTPDVDERELATA